MPSLTASPTWQALQEKSAQFQTPEFSLSALFDGADRFEQFSLNHGELLFDYSKNLIDAEVLGLLVQLAEERGLGQATAAMFSGAMINETENRPAHHIALRIPPDFQTNAEVDEVLFKLDMVVGAIHYGTWTGHTGEAITDIVNIGIGGSDLGPAMVSEALTHLHVASQKVHFVSNVDPVHMELTLRGLNPATTLFIIASKSFTTAETLANANLARAWLLEADCAASDLNKHFVAVSSNVSAAVKFGIDADNVFPMWDWVGGRYSLWSAIGLPIALAIGAEKFNELLAGAHSMDRHFAEAPLNANMPVIKAMLGIWYSEFFNTRSFAVVPYSQSLDQLPDYLQQLSMESLGKCVTKAGEPTPTNTGAVIWGTPGTNGQHSYFQLLHQGTTVVPVDFIAIANSNASIGAEQHDLLLSNCLAQSLALMEGKKNPEEPHRESPGNRPSNTWLLNELSPFALGSLLALFEHEVYVQSIIWDINAFDQWGVELGKTLAKSMQGALTDPAQQQNLDASSRGLIKQIKSWNKQEQT